MQPELYRIECGECPHDLLDFLPAKWIKDPQNNVWLLTTCGRQDYLWHIEAIMKVPAVVHGISCEPMLGPLKLPAKFLKLGKAAWVIAGGESGRQSRATRIEWLRGLRDQCLDAGVPFFFKQWGNHNSELVQIRNKHDAGRELDGRTWNEFPEPPS
jgi:protein gp37